MWCWRVKTMFQGAPLSVSFKESSPPFFYELTFVPSAVCFFCLSKNYSGVWQPSSWFKDSHFKREKEKGKANRLFILSLWPLSALAIRQVDELLQKFIKRSKTMASKAFRQPKETVYKLAAIVPQRQMHEYLWMGSLKLTRSS